MKVDWSPLTDELKLWRGANIPLPLWWRDDDAIAATPQLERLAILANDLGTPVHLAIIPDLLEPSLSATFIDQSPFVPVVHGWRHVNQAPEGAKKAEFGHPRAAAGDELRAAMQLLRAQFGDALLPLFVPPWNRISLELVRHLDAAGYSGVSTYGPRTDNPAAPGVACINTHIDPIFWQGDRGLVPRDRLIADIVTNLRDRREGRTDATEPLGLLTHHLVHTPDVWAFCGDVLRVLLDGGAAPADLAALL